MIRLSLRRRLYFLIAALTLVVVFAVQVIVIRGAEKEISEEYDAKLISDAQIIWNTVREEIAEGHSLSSVVVDLRSLVAELPPADRARILDYAETRGFRLWQDGALVKRSGNAPPESVPPAHTGFSDVEFNDTEWRIYTLETPEHDVILEVRENLSGRERLRREILIGAAGPLIGLIMVMLAALVLGIDIGLREMTTAVEMIDERSEEDLSPIDSASVPRELAPVFAALNRLFGKLRRAFALERDFVNNAAHELRTPLTVLKLQSQLAARATDEAGRRESIEALQSGITRAAVVVEQLLMLARLGTQNTPMERLNLFALAQNTVAMNGALPLGKNVTLALDGDDTVTATTNSKLVAILLGVILDNAFKYTPAQGSITLTVSAAGPNGGGPTLTVDDTGPGIPADKRDKVFDRFYRLPETVAPGSGLGLAIAKQIAERLAARISLDSPPGGRGLRVVLQFPA